MISEAVHNGGGDAPRRGVGRKKEDDDLVGCNFYVTKRYGLLLGCAWANADGLLLGSGGLPGKFPSPLFFSFSVFSFI
jgi:hypothetical protein